MISKQTNIFQDDAVVVRKLLIDVVFLQTSYYFVLCNCFTGLPTKDETV